MTARTFDPLAPLPTPPDPWRSSDQPSARPGPPYHMTDMIAAEPHVARRLLARLAATDSAAARLADAVSDAVGAGRAVIFTGCGTSEHAAQGAAEVLREALVGGRAAISAEQALELALDPPGGALVIGISHEGGTAATNRALEAARSAGSATALITAGDTSPGATLADLVVATGELDQSWCHTVGYVAPLVAGVAVAAHLTGRTPDPDRVAEAMASSAAGEEAAETMAGRLAATDHIVVLGSGADRVSGRELVLKIEEGTWIPSAYRDLETFLHGHLAATTERTGFVVLLTDPRRAGDRAARARQALAAIRVLGSPAAGILSRQLTGEIPDPLLPAGRLLTDNGNLPPAAGSLLGSAMALQLLTERLARARRTNPDPIRRDDPRYAAASDAAKKPSGEIRGIDGGPSDLQ